MSSTPPNAPKARTELRPWWPHAVAVVGPSGLGRDPRFRRLSPRRAIRARTRTLFVRSARPSLNSDLDAGRKSSGPAETAAGGSDAGSGERAAAEEPRARAARCAATPAGGLRGCVAHRRLRVPVPACPLSRPLHAQVRIGSRFSNVASAAIVAAAFREV